MNAVGLVKVCALTSVRPTAFIYTEYDIGHEIYFLLLQSFPFYDNNPMREVMKYGL